MNEALTDFLTSPRCIYLEIGADCNLDCAICANAHRYNSQHAGRRFSRQDVQTILAQLPEPPLKVILTGGEPLLHPELPGILSDLARDGIYHALYTNAVVPIRDELWNVLLHDPFLAHYTVSLHSASPDEHECLTGSKGSHQATVSNILRLKQTGVPVVVNSVLTQTTPSDVLGTIRYILGLGACFAGLTKYVRPPADAVGAPVQPPTAARLRSVAEQIEAAGLSESADIDCCHGCETGLLFHEPCYSARAFCAIKPDGTVTPCIFSSYSLGNIHSEPFRAIWLSDAARRWREGVGPSCLSCPQLDGCLGGCRAMGIDPRLAEEARTPAAENTDAPAEIPLYRGLAVVPAFDWQRGQQGVFLFQGKHVRYLAAAEVPLVEAMAREATLQEISEQFGPPAVNTVYDLYLDHMVTLR